MRDCPVCGSANRVKDWSMDYVVPDGWELPTHNDICLCENCQMIYYDNDKSQYDYDEYYRLRYNSEPALLGKTAHDRLDGLIEFIVDNENRRDIRIVDFGGGEGYVEKQLRKLGYQDICTVNVGEELPHGIDLLIASHVMEHIYDLKDVMVKLVSNLNAGGRFIVDVPDAGKSVKVSTLPILDYHQKHINHFTARTLNILFRQYGYFPSIINNYLDSKKYPALRILYTRANEADAYCEAKNWVESNVASKIEMLKKITEPVIVWGCGDICLLLLEKVSLNIVQFVDHDPAFIGQTIGGIPVLDHIEGEYPIVVIAQMQQEDILDEIKNKGIENRVYTI
jgi:hypothetical protein